MVEEEQLPNFEKGEKLNQIFQHEKIKLLTVICYFSTTYCILMYASYTESYCTYLKYTLLGLDGSKNPRNQISSAANYGYCVKTLYC